MKKIYLFLVLILISTIVLAGNANSIQAQSNPSILLKIVIHAQKQLESQINQDSSIKTKQLFKDGTQQIISLEESLNNNDTDLAKKQFLSIMKIFKETSKQLTNTQTSKVEISTIIIEDPLKDLDRLHDYVDDLKIINKKYNTTINFSEIDNLFLVAKKQIYEKQAVDALQTIMKLKQLTLELNGIIREHASKQQYIHAKEYAQKYLGELDLLIENAKNQNLSEVIIKKLIIARENLSTATNAHEIVKQIKEIISLKEQFELTKNAQIESKVILSKKIS